MKLKEQAVDTLLGLLENVGMPSVLPWSFKRIRRLFSGEPDRYLSFLEQQVKKQNWLPKFFVGHELHIVYHVDEDRVLTLLESLSGHEKEIVREGAAQSWSKLLEIDFETVFSILEDMSESDDYELRYTSALAPVHYYDGDASKEHRKQIESLWRDFENDPRQSLWNLVRTQILSKRVNE